MYTRYINIEDLSDFTQKYSIQIWFRSYQCRTKSSVWAAILYIVWACKSQQHFICGSFVLYCIISHEIQFQRIGYYWNCVRLRYCLLMLFISISLIFSSDVQWFFCLAYPIFVAKRIGSIIEWIGRERWIRKQCKLDHHSIYAYREAYTTIINSDFF